MSSLSEMPSISTALAASRLTSSETGGTAPNGSSRPTWQSAVRGRLGYARIQTTGVGDNNVLPPAMGRLRVVSYTMIAHATVDVVWKSGARPLSGPMQLLAGDTLSVQGSIDEPLLETGPGEKLVLNLSAPVLLNGHLTYFEVHPFRD